MAESRVCCEQAIEIARSIGARTVESHALNTLAVDIATLGDRSRGIEYLARVKAIAEELGATEDIGRADVNLAEMLDWDGRLRESAELSLAGVDLMGRLGVSRSVIFLGNEATYRLLRLGRLEQAAHVLARVRETGPSGFSEAIHYAAEAELARIGAEHERAIEAARRAVVGPADLLKQDVVDRRIELAHTALSIRRHSGQPRSKRRALRPAAFSVRTASCA